MAVALGLAALLACATGRAQAPEAPVRQADPAELLDCSYEYGALDSADSYVRAFNDVARSYLTAQRLHEERRRDPSATSESVDEAWKAQVAAAQTMVRACRCWEQLDRIAYEEQVLAAQGSDTKRLKAKIGRTVEAPCATVFEAERAGR